MWPIVITDRDCWAWLAGLYSGLWLVGFFKRRHRKSEAMRMAEATRDVDG